MRLIDADALANNITVLFEKNKSLIDEWLRNCIEYEITDAPTIVHTEKGKMMRLIDADALKTAFPCGEYVRTESVRATIDSMPTIDAEPVRHGKLKARNRQRNKRIQRLIDNLMKEHYTKHEVELLLKAAKDDNDEN